MAQPPDRSEAVPVPAPKADTAAWMMEFGPGLRRYFSKRASAADADDLVQEVFLRLQARAASENEVENVQRYLFTVANRVLIDRHRQVSARGGPYQPSLTEALSPVDETNPERILIGRQDVERMIVALQKLPPRAREAFIFHRFEELSYAAIGRRMGISIVAVRKLISRAAERIAQLMDGRES